MATSDSTPIQIPLAIDGATVEIPLTKGYVTIVDAIDAELLEFKWTAMIGENYRQYAYRKTGGRRNNKQVYMHRVILERILGVTLTRNQKCDHKDGNGLNNCRSNLRLANSYQNAQNSRRRTDSTSPYKGITFDKSKNKWKADIRVNGVTHRLGYFDTPETAYGAYCAAAIKLHGEFARLD